MSIIYINDVKGPKETCFPEEQHHILLLMTVTVTPLHPQSHHVVQENITQQHYVYHKPI